jgi:hypothetical protein
MASNRRVRDPGGADGAGIGDGEVSGDGAGEEETGRSAGGGEQDAAITIAPSTPIAQRAAGWLIGPER